MEHLYEADCAIYSHLQTHDQSQWPLGFKTEEIK